MTITYSILTTFRAVMEVKIIKLESRKKNPLNFTNDKIVTLQSWTLVNDGYWIKVIQAWFKKEVLLSKQKCWLSWNNLLWLWNCRVTLWEVGSSTSQRGARAAISVGEKKARWRNSNEKSSVFMAERNVASVFLLGWFQRRPCACRLKHTEARPAANEQTLCDETGRKYGRGARL